MLTIPTELETFWKTVSGGIEGMNSTASSLSDKLTDISNSCATAESGFSSYYNSENKEKILNKFGKLKEIVTKISTSVDGDLKPMISKASDLVTKVARMDELKKEVEEQEGIISTENAKVNDDDDETTPNYTLLSSARSVKYNDEQEFSRLEDESKRLLNELKGMDANLQFVSDFTSTDYLSYLDALQYGTFEQQSYKASNGVTVNYWLYIPDYGKDVEGLPIHVYMHGSGETGGGVLKCGLPKLIDQKAITPSGIVICPQASTLRDFYQADYHAALIELCDKVAEDNNADKNKISLSGHSMGAIAGYKMIANNPDYFAAFVPISGLCYVGEKVKESNTKIWIFHGAADTNCDFKNAVQTFKYLKSVGADVQMHTYPTAGHAGVQNTTFEQEFETDDGETINPLEWAFKQSLEA